MHIASGAATARMLNVTSNESNIEPFNRELQMTHEKEK
jgi:hypothetical protein